MASFLVRRGMWIGFGLLAIALALGAIASFIAGQRLSNSPLTQQFEELTGRRVVLQAPPVISFYPSLTAVFKDVSFHNWQNSNDDTPVLKAPLMRISFSVFAALMGKTRITSITLEKPIIRARAENDTWQLPFGDQAKLAKQFAALIAKLPEPPSAETVANILDQAPGPITIIGGTIILDRAATDIISNIEGQLVWMPGRRNGQLHAQGIWRGEPTKVEMDSGDVVMMVAGSNARTRVSFLSKPLTASFSGLTRLLPTPYFEGTVSAHAALLFNAAKWQNIATPFNFAAFGLTLNGAFKGDADKWQLEDSQLQLGTNKGTGSVIFQPNALPPRLSGTLDFENLDLAMLSEIFELETKIQQSHRPLFSTDLRISADSATFGGTTLKMVAASLQVSKDAAALDIHDAAAFGGALQMAFSSRNNAGSELRILAENIETQALGGLNPLFDDLPRARGSISAILHGSNIADPNFLETARGTIKIRLGEGNIIGFNANQLVQELRKERSFLLKPNVPSLFLFSEIDAEASLAQGTLQFDPLRVGLDKAVLTLNGAYALKDQSVALTGTLDLEKGHPEAINGDERLNVFFGGNRNSLLMSSINHNSPKK